MVQLHALGERAWVLQAEGEQPRLLATAAALRAQGTWLEAVPGQGNLSLFFDPLRHSASEAAQALQAAWAASARVAVQGAPRLRRLPVRYGGSAAPDLPEAAAALGLSEAALIALHSGARYRVAFLGFQPGFAYLEGLPAALHLPRRATPRERVPAGSVAIAAGLCGIYPADSPGGWWLIGHCAQPLFDARAEPCCWLQPGDELQFEALTP